MPQRPPRKGTPAASMVRSPYNQAQVDAAVAARDQAAAGSPPIVRRAFLGGAPIQLGDLEIQPLTIGTFWLLEDVKHPMASPDANAGLALSYRQIAEAALILTDPRRAAELLDKDRKHFDAAVRELSFNVPLGDLEALTAALIGRSVETQETMPPPAAGAAATPSAPPPQTRDSVGG